MQIIENLPKWAQTEMKDLQRQRDDAVAALNAAVKGSKPTNVFYEQHPITGEDRGPVSKRFHVPDNTVYFKLYGDEDRGWGKGVVAVTLRVHDWEPNICVTFDSEHITMVPRAANCISFVARDAPKRKGGGK